MKRAIRERAPLLARAVDKLVYLRAAPGSWALGTRIYASISIVAYPHAKIPGKPRGKGIKARFQPGAGWAKFPHAFEIAKRQTQWGPMVYERVGRSRFSLRVVTGPSVSTQFEAEMSAVSRVIQSKYEAELERQLKRLEGNTPRRIT